MPIKYIDSASRIDEADFIRRAFTIDISFLLPPFVRTSPLEKLCLISPQRSYLTGGNKNIFVAVYDSREAFAVPPEICFFFLAACFQPFLIRRKIFVK